MGRAMLSKSLIRLSDDGQGCVPSLLFDLRPNYGGGKEDNATSFKGPSLALLSSVPPTLQPPSTHDSSRDPWTLMDKSGSVSCGVTAPFPWVLVHTVLFLPSKSLYLQSCVSSGGSMVALMVTSSKRAYAISRTDAPRALAPVIGHCGAVPMQETLTVLAQSVGSLGPGAHKICLSPLSISGR